MLGTDRWAVLSWPVVAVSRLLPVVILAAGIAVPAAVWSQLPASRPGPLLFSLFPAVVGSVVLVPQALHPVVMQPERFDGPLPLAFLPGLLVAFVRTKLGQLALGLFLLSEATARSVGLTLESVNSAKWHFPFEVFLFGLVGSLLIALCGSLTLRRFG